MRKYETLPEMLDEVTGVFAEKKLHFPAENRSLSYGVLREQAERFAGGLYSKDIQRGELVGLMAPTCAEFFAAFFGILKASAIPVPLSLPRSLHEISSYASRLERLLTGDRIRYLTVHRDLFPFFSGFSDQIRILSPDELLQSREKAPSIDLRSSDLALVQYTSGSTDFPKGVALTHSNILASIQAITQGIQGHAGDVFGQWIPLYHDMGLIGSLTALANGAAAYFWPPMSFIKDPLGWLREFSRVRATVCAGPNFFYSYLLSNLPPDQREGLDLSSWRIAFNGSEPIDAGILENFTAAFKEAGFKPETMFPVYGLAEATLAATFPPLNTKPVIQWVDRFKLANERQVSLVNRGHPRARGLVSVGKAVWQHKVRVADEYGRVAGENKIGEIQIYGPAVTKGYYRKLEATGNAFTDDGWLKTGDLGYVSNGSLFIAGRIKEMIIIRGEKYHPEDVESLVHPVPGVYRKKCIAFGIEEDLAEKMVVLAETELQQATERLRLTDEISSRLLAHLGLSSTAVHCLKPHSIQRTTSGKYQRVLMREQLLTGNLKDSFWD